MLPSVLLTLILTFLLLIFLSWATLCLPIKSSSILTARSVGIPVLVPSPVLLCWILTGNVFFFLACFTVDGCRFCYRCIRFTFRITSSIGIGTAGAGGFMLGFASSVGVGVAGLSNLCCHILFAVILVSSCPQLIRHIDCWLVWFLTLSAERNSCLNGEIFSPKKDWLRLSCARWWLNKTQLSKWTAIVTALSVYLGK